MATPTSSTLTQKPLGLLSLLAIGVNGTVGVGIFFSPSEVAALIPGPSGAWVYALAALGMLPVAVVYGHLGRTYAEDGGPYVWARRALGPTLAFCFGWLTYVSSLFSASAVASGLGRHLSVWFGFADARIGALCCVLMLAGFAALGLKLSALGLRALTLLKLSPLLLLLLLALFVQAPTHASQVTRSFWSGEMGRAVLLVVFALQGFEVVPVLAGRAPNRRSVQTATLVSLLSCAALYALLQAGATLALGPLTATSKAPLSDAGRVLGGELFARLLGAGQLLSALGISFGQMVTTPHYLSTLGKPDGLGSWLGQTRDNGVPLRALLITVASIAILVFQNELAGLLVLSSVACLAQYAVSAISLFVLSYRARGADAEAVDRRKHLTWAALALAASCLLASLATAAELIGTASVMVAGMVLLWVTRVRRARI